MKALDGWSMIQIGSDPMLPGPTTVVCLISLPLRKYTDRASYSWSYSSAGSESTEWVEVSAGPLQIGFTGTPPDPAVDEPTLCSN